MIPMVIGNLNRPDLTRKCIKSLTEYSGNEMRIIQVDNGCDKIYIQIFNTGGLN